MNKRISDEEAVSRIRGGDLDCYEILVNRHQRHLKRLARRVLRNEADAEDAVQNAHLLAWQHLHQFAGRASFVSWISSVTVNAALTQIRKRKATFVSCDGLLNVLPATAHNPEQRLVQQNLREALKWAAGRLPDTYRTVFHLRAEEELSTAEAGKQLGITAECVKTRLLRARRMVRKSLTEDAEGIAC